MEPIQIIEICHDLGISRRALQYSFEDLMNINPATYLRMLRLNGARNDLLNCGSGRTQVKDVVARWGFWHLSRFSAEYRSVYDELPSQTIARA